MSSFVYKFAPLIVWTRPAFFMFLVYMAYLAMGALLFQWTEITEVQEDRLNSSSNELVRPICSLSSQTIEYIPSLGKIQFNGMVTVLRKDFNESEIISTFNRQAALHKREKMQAKTWKNRLGEKFLFSMILITTIGYGNVFPLSRTGRGACVAYGLVGFPLNLTFMRLLSLKFRCWLRRLLTRSRQVRDTAMLLPFAGFLFFAFFSCIFLLLPAHLVFSLVEGWSPREAFYYAFISLTTIGFGDYVAGYNPWYYQSAYYGLYVAALFLWLLGGLAFVATVMNLLSYLLGLQVMDKMDCRCRQRAEASREVTGIYKCAAELNWQLTKYTPQKFTMSKKIDEFTSMCVENPQDLRTQDLMEMMAVAEDLREKTYDEMKLLYIPDRLTKSRPQTTSSASLPRVSVEMPSEPLPPMSTFLKRADSCPSVVSSLNLVQQSEQRPRNKPLFITEEILHLARNPEK